MSIRSIIQPEDEFDVSSGAGNGASKDVQRFDMPRAAIQITMSTGTISVQGSIDGANFVNIETGITADTILNFAETASTPNVNHYWRLLRIVTTSGPTDAVAHLGAYEFTGQS